MEDLTFIEFVQEIGKGLLALPGILARFIIQPKSMIGWMLTLLIVVCLIGMALSVVLSVVK